MNIQELYAKKEELKKSGIEAVKAGKQEEAEKIKADLDKLETDIQAELLFADDENARQNQLKAMNVAQASFNSGLGLSELKPIDSAKGKTSEPQSKLDSEEYYAAFIDTLQGNAKRDQKALIQEVNAHNTGNTGILVPNTIVAGIWTAVDELYPLWRAVPKMRVNGSVTIQKNIGSTDVLGWVEENQETRMAEFQFANFDLNGHEISLGIEVSFKLNSMSRNDFVSHIQQQLAIKFGYQLSKAVYEGTGVGMGFGIKTRLQQRATDRIITTTKLEYQNLTKLFSLIKSGILNGCRIYANNVTIWSHLADMVDNNGRPILFQAVSNGSVGNIFGVPVTEAGELGNGEILIANMTRGMRCNINKDITVANEQDNRRRQNSYFLHAIVDFDVFDDECFALITATTPRATRAAK